MPRIYSLGPSVDYHWNFNNVIQMKICKYILGGDRSDLELGKPKAY